MTKDLDKRGLGAFYTRLDVAGMLAGWAIRSKSDKILEPSFGGCTFLRASYDRLKTLGADDPASQLWGFDVDRKAFDYLKDDLKISPASMNFLRADFLTSAPQPGFDSFDVVFGNPPYVAHELLNKEKRVLYRRLASKRGFEIPGKASLWVYFVLFSLPQLRPGGRIAWILPWSILTSIPGKYVQKVLKSRFSNFALFPVEEQLFESQGTRERTVILLAEDYSFEKTRGAKSLIKYCLNTRDLSKKIGKAEWHVADTSLDPLTKLRKTLDKIVAKRPFVPLSETLQIRIGVVTGNSSVFIVPKETVRDLKLAPQQVRRCLKRAGYTSSLILSDEEFLRIEASGKPSRLLVLKKGALSSNGKLRRYLSDAVRRDERESNKTYRKRSPWYSISSGAIPDGFFKFFAQEGPAFILNEAKVIASNSCYAAFLKNHDSESDNYLAMISLLILSSFGQAFLEVKAGRYGPGALKADVQHLAEFPLPVVSKKKLLSAATVLRKANEKYAKGKREAARRLADTWMRGVIRDKALEESLKESFAVCRARRLG